MPQGMLYSLVQFDRRMLNILPLVKNVYQIFLCWSLCARLLFSYQDYTMTDWGSWDENKTKIVRGRKGATYKILDDTHQKYVILALMPCHMGSTPAYYWYCMWLEKCKERPSKNYFVKLQRLDSPPHGYINTVYLMRMPLELNLNILLFCLKSVALLFYLLDLCHCLVLLLFYLSRDFFMSDPLTVCHWDRLLIEIISLCRGVASLGIFSVYILISQVDGSWGAGRR